MEIVRHWRLKAQRYRLEGSTCPICGQPAFPPRPICPHCGNHPVWIFDRSFLMMPKPYTTNHAVPSERIVG